MSSLVTKPKIAILTIKNSYKYGGVLTCVQELYKFCQKYFEPTVVFLSFDPEISTSLRSFKFDSDVRHGTYFGMNCIEIGARWAFWEPGHYVYTLPAWREILKDYKYFFMKSGSCMAAYPLVQLNKRFVMWIGASYLDDRQARVKDFSGIRLFVDKLASFKMQKIEEDIFEEADFILTISKNTKKRVEQILNRMRENMLVCNFPIKSKKGSLSCEDKKEKIVLAVGRFSDPRKNLDMLIRVFDKMSKKMQELKLYVVGKLPEDEKLAQLSSYNCFSKIVFVGETVPEKLGEYYQKASLLLLTSYQEGLGIVGLEALSYGVPVVATDCGGTRDYVVDGESGYLVGINDDDVMVEKALNILASAELQKKMRNFSLNFVEENFSEGRIHSIFKIALCRVYPELKNLFEQYDLAENIIFEQPVRQLQDEP